MMVVSGETMAGGLMVDKNKNVKMVAGSGFMMAIGDTRVHI